MNKYIVPSNIFGPIDQRIIFNTGVALILIMPFSELPWDGTFLGTLLDSDIIEKEEIPGRKIWKLSFSSNLVLVRRAINMMPCINDELLKFFNINKLGTHSVKYNSKFYILSRIEYSDKLLINNQHLVSQITRNEIQNIIAVKKKLGWSIFNENDILLRKDNMGIYHAIPLHENTICNFRNRIVTQEMYKKWIGEIINDNDLFKYSLNSNIKCYTPNEFFKLVNQIENEISRIEPKLIYIINEIKRIIMLLA